MATSAETFAGFAATRALRDFWERYRRSRLAVGGLVLVIGLVLVAILAPVLAPYDPISPSLQSLRPP